jgi:hypothetical protein
MCGLCGMFDSGRGWVDALSALDPATARRERMRRLAIVREVLAPTRVKVDDFEGASFVIRGPTGATALVSNLMGLWRESERLGKRRLDPLRWSGEGTRP